MLPELSDLECAPQLLACDRKFSLNPIDNLCEYVRRGEHMERCRSISFLGVLKAHRTLPFLVEILRLAANALVDEAPLSLPGSEGHALSIGAEVCSTLGRMDYKESHETLKEYSNWEGDQYLRAAAISAMGYECNFHDDELIRSFIAPTNATLLRVAAIDAIFETRGLRLQSYKQLLIELLSDRSPYVVLSAVDALVLFLPQDTQILPVLEPLRGDLRYCRVYRSTVSDYLKSYL